MAFHAHEKRTRASHLCRLRRSRARPRRRRPERAPRPFFRAERRTSPRNAARRHLQARAVAAAVLADEQRRREAPGSFVTETPARDAGRPTRRESRPKKRILLLDVLKRRQTRARLSRRRNERHRLPPGARGRHAVEPLAVFGDASRCDHHSSERALRLARQSAADRPEPRVDDAAAGADAEQLARSYPLRSSPSAPSRRA